MQCNIMSCHVMPWDVMWCDVCMYRIQSLPCKLPLLIGSPNVSYLFKCDGNHESKQKVILIELCHGRRSSSQHAIKKKTNVGKKLHPSGVHGVSSRLTLHTQGFRSDDPMSPGTQDSACPLFHCATAQIWILSTCQAFWGQMSLPLCKGDHVGKSQSH